jgi:hypothetical protein
MLRTVRKIFGPKRDEVVGDGKGLYSQELPSFWKEDGMEIECYVQKESDKYPDLQNFNLKVARERDRSEHLGVNGRMVLSRD